MLELSYRERIALLRKKKIEHTEGKVRQNGYMDSDDYGTVPLPEGFCFKPVPNHPDGGFYGLDGMSENYTALLGVHPVYVDPLEILCGRWMTMLTEHRKGWPTDRFPFDHLEADQKQYGIASGIGADAHFACDYTIGLEAGWGGLLEKVRKYMKLNPDGMLFYAAEEKVILGIQGFIRRHIHVVRGLLSMEERPEIRRSLQRMLEANEWVVEKAPRTFLEACQWISWFNIVSRIYDRDGAGCQLDVMLLPYYEGDKAAGELNDEEAVFILANLLLIETHYYQLAGADEFDRDQTNKVSWLILEAAHCLNTSCNLTIRVHDAIDSAFLQKSIEYLFIHRNGWPRYSGDKGLMGFMKKGYTKKDARSRIAVGCNWMAVPGREYPLNDCVKINTARVFEYAFYEMMAQGAPSLEGLWNLFSVHMKKAVGVTAAGINHHLDHQHKVMPELVMNLMMKNTIEQGMDITQCAEMINIGVDGAGLGTVADSFAALEQRIVIEGVTTWEEVNAALQSNFAEKSGERIKRMLASSERYCQGNSLGDKWAYAISMLLTELVNNQPMPQGRKMIPGWFSWSSTITFGMEVGATPNGRMALAPITHGANPTPGFRKDGAATGMATGIAGIQPGFGNPAPMQLEMDPCITMEEGGIDRVLQLLKGHFEMGGTLVNINILDKEKILEAHKDPTLFPDLVVRVTGFTAYFAALSPEFRQLVVDRFIEGI